jgi:hypothetical protein
MPKFARAALLVMAMSAPVLVGALTDDSVVSVLGAPDTGGGCSSNCSVGGSKYDGGGTGAINSGGKAEGGYKNFTGTAGENDGFTFSYAGTLAGNGGRSGSGHSDVIGSTISGNFNTLPGTGHCTGTRASLCSTGPK